MEVNEEVKHTAGPWSVPHFAEPDVNCECGYVLTDQYMGAVCTVHVSGEGNDWQSHGDNPRFAEACANARLIAASPTLFAYVEARAAEGDAEAQRLVESVHAAR
jgi:hypothetical protein